MPLPYLCHYPRLYSTTTRPLSYLYPQTALGASSSTTYPYLSH